MSSATSYRLVGPDGSVTVSETPGAFGGHRRRRIYGRLDCKAARRALTFGGSYAQQRVFFADEATARAAGFRPCATCMPEEYKAWKAGR
jgi:methylphosphotriester-DNA--protein-cysteine methyltransferase